MSIKYDMVYNIPYMIPYILVCEIGLRRQREWRSKKRFKCLQSDNLLVDFVHKMRLHSWHCIWPLTIQNLQPEASISSMVDGVCKKPAKAFYQNKYQYGIAISIAWLGNLIYYRLYSILCGIKYSLYFIAH